MLLQVVLEYFFNEKFLLLFIRIHGVPIIFLEVEITIALLPSFKYSTTAISSSFVKRYRLSSGGLYTQTSSKSVFSSGNLTTQATTPYIFVGSGMLQMSFLTAIRTPPLRRLDGEMIHFTLISVKRVIRDLNFAVQNFLVQPSFTNQ